MTVYTEAARRPPARDRGVGSGAGCIECGKPLSGARRDFCDRRCKSVFWNARRALALHVLHLGLRWRRTRDGRRMTELWRVLGKIAEADRARGVGRYPDPPPHLIGIEGDA